MPLAVGARLGPYEIVGPLDAGGMGEVYRARDGRLGRDVAIKVLAADLTDLQRRRRDSSGNGTSSPVLRIRISSRFMTSAIMTVSHLLSWSWFQAKASATGWR